MNANRCTENRCVETAAQMEAEIARLERRLACEVADGCYGGDIRDQIDLLRYRIRTGENW